MDTSKQTWGFSNGKFPTTHDLHQLPYRMSPRRAKLARQFTFRKPIISGLFLQLNLSVQLHVSLTLVVGSPHCVVSTLAWATCSSAAAAAASWTSSFRVLVGKNSAAALGKMPYYITV
jgi:hypothetical protein